jgi:deazaflavin-dependent oxidoreductase (nitroreductase family)
MASPGANGQICIEDIVGRPTRPPLAVLGHIAIIDEHQATGHACGMVSERYVEPGWFTRNVFNRLVAAATRTGVSIWGSRILEVRGRSSGQIRQTPVNLLSLGDSRYLVAPRGVTQWVRNLRAAGQGTLRLGRRSESFHATEIPDSEKVPVLRAYLKRWKVEVGVFFDGVGPDADDADLRRIAPDHPVFRIDTKAH